MSSGSRWVLGVVGLVLLAGCNDEGVMELELRLPPAPEAFDVGPCDAAGACGEGTCEAGRCIYRGEWHSQLEISSSFAWVSASGPVQWQPSSLEAVPLARTTEDSRWSCTSVVGDPSVDVVRVRLRYCRSLPCGQSLQPEVQHWIEIERPFYGGRRTHVRRVAPSLPDRVSRCVADAECGTAAEGPVCLAGSLSCGCTDDAQCPEGHCEGAQTELGEGRCTLDIERCYVTGCITGVDPLSATNVCRMDGSHPCEENANGEAYVRPSGNGCFGQVR